MLFVLEVSIKAKHNDDFLIIYDQCSSVEFLEAQFPCEMVMQRHYGKQAKFSPMLVYISIMNQSYNNKTFYF